MPEVTFSPVNNWVGNSFRGSNFDLRPISGTRSASNISTLRCPTPVNTVLTLAGDKNTSKTCVFLTYSLAGILPGSVINSAKLLLTPTATTSTTPSNVRVHVIKNASFNRGSATYFRGNTRLRTFSGGLSPEYHVALQFTNSSAGDLADSGLDPTVSTGRISLDTRVYGNGIVDLIDMVHGGNRERIGSAMGGVIIPSSTGLLNSINMGVLCSDFTTPPAGQAWVELWADTTAGTLIEASTKRLLSSFSGSFEYATFTFSGSTTVNSGTKYAVFLMSDGDPETNDTRIAAKAGSGSDSCNLASRGNSANMDIGHYPIRSEFPFPASQLDVLNGRNLYNTPSFELGTWTAGVEAEILLDGTNGTIIQDTVNDDQYRGTEDPTIPRGIRASEAQITLCIMPMNVFDHSRNIYNYASEVDVPRLVVNYDQIDNTKFMG